LVNDLLNTVQIIPMIDSITIPENPNGFKFQKSKNKLIGNIIHQIIIN